MNDLISREKLKDDIAVLLERNGKLIDKWLANLIDDVIDEQPIVDAVPVVRCKNCKYSTEHYDTDGNVSWWGCSEWDSGTDADGFCYLERRRDDEIY